ncbi:hypothetical protein NtRootA4_27520 [Arthrobacter sp. NtRootA4]|nr:hypothetical protein NtRootA2_29710 [Arthrobacter sp. NtRootA2]BCW15773.1 hypothetical protein NtRootA4_27520 [Arthrobacter sp. NtRootA4]BCW32645.1 hypothetical protein NtRootD5_29760 [Arthrobacter sp. NtRootD5]
MGSTRRLLRSAGPAFCRRACPWPDVVDVDDVVMLDMCLTPWNLHYWRNASRAQSASSVRRVDAGDAPKTIACV